MLNEIVNGLNLKTLHCRYGE